MSKQYFQTYVCMYWTEHPPNLSEIKATIKKLPLMPTKQYFQTYVCIYWTEPHPSLLDQCHRFNRF